MSSTPGLRLTYEEYPWEVSPKVAHLVGSLETQRLTRPYKAAVPVAVADLDLLPLISRQAREAATGASAQIVEFDAEMSALPAPIPAILGLNSHENALLIAANVAAMRSALAHLDATSPEDVLTLHRVLLEHSQPDI